MHRLSAAGHNLPYAVYKELHSKPRAAQGKRRSSKKHSRLQPTCVEAQPAPVLGFGFGESLGARDIVVGDSPSVPLA